MIYERVITCILRCNVTPPPLHNLKIFSVIPTQADFFQLMNLEKNSHLIQGDS